MGKIPIVKAKDFFAALIKYDCVHISTRGSHHKVMNPATGNKATVPVHAGKDLSKELFVAILNQLGIDIDDFIPFL
jgi:predicted RNA binding protein YcfA (HicA-like mRNA interferase family)